LLPTRTPALLRKLFPSLTWSVEREDKCVYLTFDDGPHPEITPWVMKELDKFGFKATFFCIGDNVQKYPETYQEILNNGHRTGNHTFNHLKGFSTSSPTYFENIQECAQLVKSELYRPPYGQITFSQIKHLSKKYQIIMWSLLVEDWNPKLDQAKKLSLLSTETKSGDIIVFHDSEKAFENLKVILPAYLEFMSNAGFSSVVF
jgi:peptidoglycan/xylan/chitin deacetylase (PgdA/CDA1 family)